MFNAQEQEIIVAGRTAGKTPQEIMDAIKRYRTGYQPPAQDIAGPDNYGSKVVDAAKSGVSKVSQGISELADGKFPIGPALKVGAGLVETASAPLAPITEPIGKAVTAVADKVSDIPAVQDFAMSKAGETTAKVAEGVADASTIAGVVAGGAMPKPNLSGLLESDAKAAAAVAAKPAQARPSISAGIVQRINRINPTKQAQFQQMTGSTVGEYLVDRNIIGTSDQTVLKLAERMKQSQGEVDKALATRPELFKTPVALSAIRALESKVENTSTPGAVSPIAARVRALSKKLTGEGLTLSELNEVKRLYERNVKLDYLKANLPEKVQLANNVDSSLRSYIFDRANELGIENVPALNKETQAAKFLIDEIGRSSAGRAANNAITLTDWLLLAEGAGNPTALASFLGKKGLSSETFRAWVARKLAPAPGKAAKPKAKIGAPKANAGDYAKERDFFDELDRAIRGTKKK